VHVAAQKFALMVNSLHLVAYAVGAELVGTQEAPSDRVGVTPSAFNGGSHVSGTAALKLTSFVSAQPYGQPCVAAVDAPDLVGGPQQCISPPSSLGPSPRSQLPR
jgi:hypothetical protein